ncbi:hypothetical protein H8E77_03365 [bacterium]|nr:hypothetical protein [bacterium]
MIKEIITKEAIGQYTVAKQFHGYGNWARVVVKISPNENVADYNIYFNLSKDGYITNISSERLSDFKKAILTSVKYDLSNGILAGLPVVQLDVTIVRIDGLPGETTPESVKYAKSNGRLRLTATCQAIWEAMYNAKPELIDTDSGRRKPLSEFELLGPPEINVFFDEERKSWIYGC